MSRHRYPVRANLQNTFYYLYIRFLKLAPKSLLLTMLFLLVGFSMTTGFLLNRSNARIEEIPPTLATGHLSAGPAFGAEMSEPAQPHYAICLGSSVVKKNFADVKQLADSLEQPFHIKIGDKKVTMTRLYLGTFPIKEANILFNKLSKIAPGAFILQEDQGRKAAVYAGSFYYRTDVGNLQKELVQKGFETIQVPAKVTLPLYSVYLGDFDSQEKAAAFVRTAGLPEAEMPVVAIN